MRGCRCVFLCRVAPATIPALTPVYAGAGRTTPLEVFVQVNTSSEPQKGGVDPDACVPLVSHVKDECPNLKFQGLMTIGAYGVVASQFFVVRAHSLHMHGRRVRNS